MCATIASSSSSVATLAAFSALAAAFATRTATAAKAAEPTASAATSEAAATGAAASDSTDGCHLLRHTNFNNTVQNVYDSNLYSVWNNVRELVEFLFYCSKRNRMFHIHRSARVFVEFHERRFYHEHQSIWCHEQCSRHGLFSRRLFFVRANLYVWLECFDAHVHAREWFHQRRRRHTADHRWKLWSRGKQYRDAQHVLSSITTATSAKSAASAFTTASATKHPVAAKSTESSSFAAEPATSEAATSEAAAEPTATRPTSTASVVGVVQWLPVSHRKLLHVVVQRDSTNVQRRGVPLQHRRRRSLPSLEAGGHCVHDRAHLVQWPERLDVPQLRRVHRPYFWNVLCCERVLHGHRTGRVLGLRRGMQRRSRVCLRPAVDEELRR